MLRKKPPGTLLSSAHAVDRAYRVMKALQNTEVPVPRTLALCADTNVIGTELYVMAMVVSRVFHNPVYLASALRNDVPFMTASPAPLAP